jgi:phosphoglycerate dehydrogenase-like enzyme
VTRLLIYDAAYAGVAGEIARIAPDLDVLVMDSAGGISLRGEPVAPADARPEIVWADHHAFLGPANRAFFTAALKSPVLHFVQSAAAGFDHPLFGQIVAKGASLGISHGQAVGIADHVLRGVLDHFQDAAGWRADQAARVWRPRAFRELNGTAWLIIGFGAIGQAVARRARAFGAAITGVRRDLTPHPDADGLAPLSAVHGHLPASDVVVLCCPLNAHTRDLADARFFAVMKPGSVIVNVGRGGLVNETALLAALDAGVPEHAVLDVFRTEPLPEDSPFWTHPRVSLTPHAAGITAGQDSRNAALFLDNLHRYLTGQPLVGLADPRDVLGG